MSSNKKVPQTKKGKKSVPGRKAPRAQAPKKRPFRLEVGKTYLSENGKEVEIVCVDEDGDFSDVDNDLIGCLWKKDGTPWRVPGYTDSKYGRLIREVRPVKARGK